MSARRLGANLWKFSLLGAAALGIVLLARAQSPVSARISAPVDSTQMSPVKGSVHPLARAEFDRGKVDGSTKLQHVTLVFRLSPDQQKALDNLLAEQQDRSSPNYHRWLTPEQYAQQFGMSQADLDKVSSWLQSRGFQVESTARSRTSIVFSGTAAQVESALHTEIHRYAINGETHFANAGEPSVPSAFSGVVLGFRGLDDFRPKPRAFKSRANVAANPKFTSSISGNNYIAPPDFATIYDLSPTLYTVSGNVCSNNCGTTQKIAVMGQTDVVMSDISTFRSLSGLPANIPTVTLIPGPDPGEQFSTGDLSEADLDLEWSGAVAPNATIIFVNSGTANGVFDSFAYAVDNNEAPVISNSYGVCEAEAPTSQIASMQQLAQQANAQGITVIAPSGDDGATDCDYALPATFGLAVDFPGSLPNVTAIGGTEFNEGSGKYWATASGSDVISSALSYIPEMVWNDTAFEGVPSAGGGGPSSLFAKPTWQAGAGVPNDGARDVPDISVAASPDHDGYLICTQEAAGGSSPSCINNTFRDGTSSLSVYGGTSMGVPTFAAMVALINQATGSAGQGNVNPTLYALAATATPPFHDITSGNNEISFQPATLSTCSTPAVSIGYAASPGYDLATGLGSMDAGALVNQWSAVTPLNSSPAAVDFQMAFTAGAITVHLGTCGTATVAITPVNGFSGIPSFTCSVSTNLGATACSVTQTAIAGSPNHYALSVAVPTSLSLGATPKMIGFYERLLALPILICALWVFFDRRRRVHNASLGSACEGKFLSPKVASLLALGLLLAVFIGCSHSSATNNNAASVTGTVTVTAMIGGISHTATINVTAQ